MKKLLAPGAWRWAEARPALSHTAWSGARGANTDSAGLGIPEGRRVYKITARGMELFCQHDWTSSKKAMEQVRAACCETEEPEGPLYLPAARYSSLEAKNFVL